MNRSRPQNPFLSDSPEATLDHGKYFGACQRSGLILLEGELGAGKTLWTRGFAEGMGLPADVYSPTYTVLNVYRQADLALYHLDLYRLNCFEEIHDLGLFEALDAGFPCVVEWPERVPELSALPHLRVRIEAMGEQTRSLMVEEHCPS